ncbi:hypothetical protein DFH08DRAFT_841839 [Mycena albidolilacea]|uniref:Uncharacterized protein n=1 Tax=Mycena albidolilacea TaxID=1033008 RepID=A0AAD7AMK8_9AGAR|nr:hypothetical protein DFH08DRAFT_841839 [Mycena albidolilacea]
MSESPSTGTRAAEGNKGERSPGAEKSHRQRAESKKGNPAVNLALSYSWLVVLMITVCVDACPRKNEWGSTEAPAVGSARAAKEVPSCGSYGAECHMWSDCGIVFGSRARRAYGEATGRRGDTPTTETQERCWPWRLREDEKKGGGSTGFVSMTRIQSSNSERGRQGNRQERG